jgi:hypothetical protein
MEKKINIRHATPDAMAAVFVLSRRVFPFVNNRKKGRLPKGSMIIISGTRTVMKCFSISRSSGII